jgi:hypothetical protein
VENQSEIQYEIDANDLTAFYVYNFQNNPKLKWFRIAMSWSLIGLGILLLIFAVISILSFDESQTVTIALVLFGLYCLFFGIFSFKISNKLFLANIYKRMYAKPNRISGKHRLSINSECTTDINEVGQNITRWNGISWFAFTDKYLFLVGSDNTIINIVPKRAFNNETSFNQFIVTAKSYYEKSAKHKNPQTLIIEFQRLRFKRVLYENE